MSNSRRSSVGGRSSLHGFGLGLPRGVSARQSLGEEDFPDDESYATAGQGEWESVVRSVRSVPERGDLRGSSSSVRDDNGGPNGPVRRVPTRGGLLSC
jgi:hypothetical protein